MDKQASQPAAPLDMQEDVDGISDTGHTRSAQGEANRADAARTRQQRETFFWRLPDWISAELVILFAIGELLALTVSGFAGYTFSPGLLRRFPFTTPAAPFGYGCALATVLLWLILNHPMPQQEITSKIDHPASDRRQFAIAFTVLLIAIVVDALIYLRPGIVTQLLNELASWLGFVGFQRLLANAVNLWIISVYAFDLVSRRVVSARNLWKARATRGPRETELKRALRLLGNDSVAGGALIGLTAYCFRADMLSAIVSTLQIGQRVGGGRSVTDCMVSMHPGVCDPLSRPDALPTIAFADTILALSLLATGLISLLFYVAVRVITDRRPLGEVIRQALGQLGGIRRALQLILGSLFAPFRRTIWPIFTFVGVGAIGGAAIFTTHYLHLLSCQGQWLFFGSAYGITGPYGPMCETTVPFDSFPLNYQYIGLALLCAALALVALILSAVTQVSGEEDLHRLGALVSYWFPTLTRLGGLSLIVGGLLTLPMTVLNGVVLLVANASGNATPPPMSYFPPGVFTYFALAVSLAAALWWLVSRRSRLRRERVRLAQRVQLPKATVS